MIDILTVVHNSFNCLKRFVLTLDKAGYPYRLILIDNGSTRTETKFILGNLAKREDTSVFCLEENLLFTRAINFGFEKCQSELVLVINPDCFAIESDWLSKLTSYMQKDIGVIGTLQIRSDGLIDHAGGYGDGKHIGYAEFDKGQYAEPRNVEWVTGACALVRKELVPFPLNDRLGNYLIHFGSDVEFCRQVWELGYRVICAPVKFIHNRGESWI